MESLTPLPTQLNRVSNRERLQLFCLATIMLWSLGNFSVIPLAESVRPNSSAVYLVVGWHGVIFGQLALHSIVATLWATSLRRRIGWGVVSAAILTLAWILGFFVANQRRGTLSPQMREAIFGVVGCLPLFMLAVQLPLWLFRFCHNWRVATAEWFRSTPKVQAWRIQHLMCGTAAVAIALSLTRVAKPDNIPTDEFFVPVLLGACITGLVSLVHVPVSVLATLRARRVAPAIAGLMVLNMATYGLILLIGTVLAGSRPDREVYFGLAAIFFGFGFSTIVPLLILRSFGFRLSLGRDAAGFGGEGMGDDG